MLANFLITIIYRLLQLGSREGGIAQFFLQDSVNFPGAATGLAGKTSQAKNALVAVALHYGMGGELVGYKGGFLSGKGRKIGFGGRRGCEFGGIGRLGRIRGSGNRLLLRSGRKKDKALIEGGDVGIRIIAHQAGTAQVFARFICFQSGDFFIMQAHQLVCLGMARRGVLYMGYHFQPAFGAEEAGYSVRIGLADGTQGFHVCHIVKVQNDQFGRRLQIPGSMAAPEHARHGETGKGGFQGVGCRKVTVRGIAADGVHFILLLAGDD